MSEPITPHISERELRRRIASTYLMQFQACILPPAIIWITAFSLSGQESVTPWNVLAVASAAATVYFGAGLFSSAAKARVLLRKLIEWQKHK